MRWGPLTVRWSSIQTYAAQRLGLSALAIISGLGVLGCAAAAGAAPAAWAWGVGLLAALGLGTSDARIQAGAWSALIGGWVAVVPAGFSWWALPAAVLALVAHTTTVLTAGLPRQLVWPKRTLLRHARRIAVVAAFTGVVAVSAWAVDERRVGGTVLVALPALLVVAGWVWLVRDDSRAPSAEPGRHA